MADVKISQLPAASTPLAGTEEIPLVQSSTTKQITVSNLLTSANLGTPTAVNLANATNVPMAQAAGVLAVAHGGNGTSTPSLVAGTNVTISGSWPNQTVNATASGSGSVTSVGTGTGLTGGPITTSGTIALANTAVTAGSYTSANITVDAQGRITAAANGSGGGGGVTSVTGTAPVVSSGGTTPAISMAKATTSVDGYLSATDWNTFNNKQPAGSYLTNGGALGTPSSGTATNLTGLPLSTGVTGILPVANGGTGTTTPALVAGTNVTITGTWPNQTINSTGGGSGMVYPGAGIPNSTGSAWGTSYSTSGSGTVIPLATGATLTTPTQATYENWTPTTAPSFQEGRLWYDSTSKTLAYFNDVSSAVVHVGQDTQFKVINNTGSTIANGSPVYITGTSSGQTYPNVALAKADTVATSAVIGLTNGSIANGAFGYVTAQGGIDNVNTGAFTVGQILYLSPYSAGQLMNTVPPTGYAVQVGTVSYVDSSAGKIFVKQTTPLAVSAGTLVGAVAIANGGTGQTTAAAAITALTGTQTAGRYLRSDGTNASLAAIQAADVPTLNQNTTGTASNVTGTVALANGGSGQTTAQTAMNAFAGAVTSGSYLRGNGTNVVMATIQAADVPTLNQNTTGTAANITATSNATLTTLSVLSLPGSQVTGNISGNAANVTGTVAIANGGTGQTTAAAAITALTGTQVSGQYLRSNGTNAVLSAIQAADVPTLNQNTTGTAANVTGTVAVANGGTGATSLTANNVILGNGTSAVQVVAPSTSGNVLTSNGTTWVSQAPAASGVSQAKATAIAMVFGF